MHFSHSTDLWTEYPELVPGVLAVDGISAEVTAQDRLGAYEAIARARLAAQPEGEFPEIQAWRRTFARMGLKPTQYRCAAEALLRRFRKDGSLPRIHPLIDLCNAISLAFAVPIAVFDAAKISGNLEVRHATGAETYESFSGEIEQPPGGEVIFADGAGRAHARRWTNRQSAYSAIRDDTSSALIVAEAVHATARADMERLVEAIAGELDAVWSTASRTALLTGVSPRFEFVQS